MQRLASILSFAALTVVASAQFSIVIPNGMAAAEGSTSNAFPWGRGGTGIRIQTIYDSSHFTAQGVTFPVLITGLRWRPNNNVGLSASSYPATNTVKLSTCPVDQAAVTTAFANQIGADVTTCYSGPVSWAAQPAQAGPTPFGISVPFTTNFLYDPSLGDLNIECEMPIQAFTGAGPQLDVHGTAPLASRAYLTTAYTPGGATATGITLNHGMVVEVSYTPASGLYSAFSANVTSGPSPLAVNFTDQTFSSDPGGITSWAWDFNGDNSTDSTLQNPSWSFDCGTHSVSLTVTDATHAPSTVTRANIIVTDTVTPNFSWQAVGGNVVNFTDTTTPPATSWAWDFNNDNIIDSVDQNPSFGYPSTAMTSTVRLTTSRLCGPAASVSKVIVTPTLALQTLFTGGTGQSNSGAGNCFDLTVTNPLGVNLTGVTMCPSAAASLPIGTPLTVDMYITRAAGGWAANHTNAAVWRKVATGTGIYRGGTATAPVPIDMTFAHGHYLPPGAYGVALHMNGCGVAYTTGTASNQTYANADVTVQCGNAKSQRFNFQNLTPRVWNGVLYYDLGGQTDFTPPVANAGADTPIGVANVYLDGSASSDETSSTSELEYEWTLTAKPSTSTAVLNGANLGPTGPWFHADVWGEYRVSLVVIDLQGNRSDPDEVVFTLPQDITPPTAVAGPDVSYHPGNYVVFDGSSSYDDVTTSTSLVYEWTITSQPAGSYAYLNVWWNGAYEGTFYADSVGEYRVSLVVVDEQGNRSAIDEFVISSYNMAPVAIAGPDQIGALNSWVYIYGYESYDPDYDYLSGTWTITSAPTGSNAYFAYGGYWYYDYLVPDVVGTYELSLIVNDQWGGYSAPDTLSVVVVTSAQFAAIKLGEASTQIGTFDPAAFAAPGHKNSLRNQLAQIARLIQNNNLTQARASLEDLMSRTDGWLYRNAFDPQGLGQPYAADFIVGQYEQYDIWYRLSEAMSYLSEGAQYVLGQASAQIGTFDPAAFDAPGHQNSLRNQLAQIATLIQNNNLTQARAHLEEMISRTDGWPLRSAFDPQGLGQPFAADFIVGYYEQYDIWYRLQEALSYLNQ